MIALILAGGMGTRILEETREKPKPLVMIGGKPIIWHIMMIYRSQGVKDFLVAGGYKFEMLGPEIKRHIEPGLGITFEVLDTGLLTATGGRIKKCIESTSEDTYFATYGDGVGNIDLNRLLKTHREGSFLATLTAVRPPARFGRVVVESNTVTHFGEKNQADEGWINGGFFALEREVANYIPGDAEPLEQYPFTRLSEKKLLGANLHNGFWQPMDTLREKLDLENLWLTGKPPWKTW